MLAARSTKEPSVNPGAGSVPLPPAPLPTADAGPRMDFQQRLSSFSTACWCCHLLQALAMTRVARAVQVQQACSYLCD
eukprot:767934-Hanusia_phi.AAC.1